VNSGTTNFAVEWRAVNEATFQCADELGWQTQVWNSNFTIATIVIQVVFFTSLKPSPLCAQHAPIITEDGPISHIREVPCLHSLNGIETSVGQFFDFVKNLQFRFLETLQNLRTSVSGTFSNQKNLRLHIR
jgi:hypothetical protein